MTNSLLCLAGLAGLVGCGPNITIIPLAAGHAPRPSNAPITAYSVKLPKCEFEELGLISVRERRFGNGGLVLEALKEEALKMGADALIGLREVPPNHEEKRRGLAATAIRFVNPECQSEDEDFEATGKAA